MGLTVKEIEKAISEDLGAITADHWKKCTDHVLHVEKKYIYRTRWNCYNIRAVHNKCNQ